MNYKNNFITLQKAVDQTVRGLGGYWVPLSGLARVLEELGELGEHVLKKNLGKEFADELADIQSITFCIANQYCANVDISSVTSQSKLTLSELYLKLVIDCGQLARIINAYEGNKKLKATEKIPTVEEQTSLISLDIQLIAQNTNLDITKVVTGKLEQIRRRDKDRFNLSYDPSTSSARDAYILLMKPTDKVWGLRENIAMNINDDLKNNEDTIKRFLKIGQLENIQSLVLQISNKSYDSTLSEKYKKMLKLTQTNSFIILSRNEN